MIRAGVAASDAATSQADGRGIPQACPAGCASAGLAAGLPASMLLVRVFGDGIEVDEHYSQEQTAALVKQLRGLGVFGKIVFRTPCG